LQYVSNQLAPSVGSANLDFMVRGFLAYPRGGMSGVGLRNFKINGDIGQAAASAFDMPHKETCAVSPAAVLRTTVYFGRTR
jgi:hypothetical protein